MRRGRSVSKIKVWLQKEYTIPITWEVGNYVRIKARDIDEALQIAENIDYLPIEGAEYVDGSFRVIEEVAREING